jgi:hypothetical protein
MSYEPELNDPIFYADEPEDTPPKCFICSEELSDAEIVWADEAGWVQEKGQGRTWCEPCIIKEGKPE